MSTNNGLHGSGRAVEKSGIFLQIEKAPATSGGDLTCYIFSLEDAVVHLRFTDPSGVLTTEKQKNQVVQNGKPHVGNFLNLPQIYK